jgi:hypothetical protein
VTAENQIHDAALRDPGLLSAGEQSTRELLARLLGTVGIKKVIVDFGQPRSAAGPVGPDRTRRDRA